MKFKLLFLAISILFASTVSAQFFKPIPKPSASQKLGASLANPVVKNEFRPLAGVTAALGDGSSLAGGVGLGFQHLLFDEASQTWTTQYSISGIAFLDTRASVIGGAVFGFANGLLQIGPGYNFTTKQFVVLTGFGIKFN